MTSRTEQALTALHAVLAAAYEGAAMPGAFRRNVSLDDRLEAWGAHAGARVAAVMFDGTPNVEAQFLGAGEVFDLEHTAEIEILVQGKPGTKEAALDAILEAIAAAVEADRALGDTVDWCEVGVPERVQIPADGGDDIIGATVPIRMNFTSTRSF